jgi:hypothetical protein
MLRLSAASHIAAAKDYAIVVLNMLQNSSTRVTVGAVSYYRNNNALHPVCDDLKKLGTPNFTVEKLKTKAPFSSRRTFL